MAIDADREIVAIETVLGVIEITVFPNRAPLSSRAFLALAEDGALEGFGAFHRVVRADNDHGFPRISVVQGGLQGSPKSPPRIAHESTVQTGMSHKDGTVSLARGAAGTATGAAFFICLGEQPALDFGGTRNPDGQGFAAFGLVTVGIATVRSIHGLPCRGATHDPYLQGQLLDPPVRMSAVRRKRGDAHG